MHNGPAARRREETSIRTDEVKVEVGRSVGRSVGRDGGVRRRSVWLVRKRVGVMHRRSRYVIAA